MPQTNTSLHNGYIFIVYPMERTIP